MKLFMQFAITIVSIIGTQFSFAQTYHFGSEGAGSKPQWEHFSNARLQATADLPKQTFFDLVSSEYQKAKEVDVTSLIGARVGRCVNIWDRDSVMATAAIASFEKVKNDFGPLVPSIPDVFQLKITYHANEGAYYDSMNYEELKVSAENTGYTYVILSQNPALAIDSSKTWKIHFKASDKYLFSELMYAPENGDPNRNYNIKPNSVYAYCYYFLNKSPK
jgi:hypothetical protein